MNYIVPHMLILYTLTEYKICNLAGTLPPPAPPLEIASGQMRKWDNCWKGEIQWRERQRQKGGVIGGEGEWLRVKSDSLPSLLQSLHNGLQNP